MNTAHSTLMVEACRSGGYMVSNLTLYSPQTVSEGSTVCREHGIQVKMSMKHFPLLSL